MEDWSTKGVPSESVPYDLLPLVRANETYQTYL